MRFTKGCELEGVTHRSQVIKKILDTKEEFCPTTEVAEYILTDCSTYPPSNSSFIFIAEVAQAMCESERCVIDSVQKNVDMKTLLFFDPYFCHELYKHVWPESDREVDLTEVIHALDSTTEIVSDINEKWKKEILKTNSGMLSYLEFRERCDSYSIFCGRNPQTLSKLPEPPQQLCEQSLKRNIEDAETSHLSDSKVSVPTTGSQTSGTPLTLQSMENGLTVTTPNSPKTVEATQLSSQLREPQFSPAATDLLTGRTSPQDKPTPSTSCPSPAANRLTDNSTSSTNDDLKGAEAEQLAPKSTIQKKGISGPPGSRVPTIDDLKKKCSVTDDQLNQEITSQDIEGLAQCFSNVDRYLNELGLSRGEQTDVSDIANREGTASGMRKAFNCIIEHNPFTKFLEIVKIALTQNDGMTAKNICCYLRDKGSPQQSPLNTATSNKTGQADTADKRE